MAHSPWSSRDAAKKWAGKTKIGTREEAEARVKARGLQVVSNKTGRGMGWRDGTTPYVDPDSGHAFFVKDRVESDRAKADSRVGVRDEAVLEGKTRKKLRKSEQLRAQRRSKRRLRVGGNLSIGTKGDPGVGTGGSKKSSLNIPKG